MTRTILYCIIWYNIVTIHRERYMAKTVSHPTSILKTPRSPRGPKNRGLTLAEGYFEYDIAKYCCFYYIF